MRALITNDDGITSPGLRALAEVALDAGLEVLMAAPTGDRSGTGASLSSVEEDGRIVIHPCPAHAPRGAEAIAVAAAPAFIVQSAMAGAFGDVPDIVLSGINLGVNTGHAVLHSGTVGAASTAATHGSRAMAVSVVASARPRWDTAAAVAARVLPWLRTAPAGTVLNLNAPDLAPADLRGIRSAALARFGAVEARVHEQGEGWVTFTYADVTAELEPGTDAALLADGHATYTLIRPVSEATTDPVPELEQDGNGPGDQAAGPGPAR